MPASFLWASETAVLPSNAARVARVQGINLPVIICHLLRGSIEEPGRQCWKLRTPGSAAAPSHRCGGKGLHFVQPKAEAAPVWQLSRRGWRGFSPDRAARDREVSPLLGDSALPVTGYGFRGPTFR